MPPQKRRSAARRAALLAALALLGLFALRVALWRPAVAQGTPFEDRRRRAVGVVHVHTRFSDGGGWPEEVARAARAAGLQFVFISDHNNLDAKPFEGYHDGVLVGVGAELSTTAGHLLALGLADPQFRFGGEPEQALDDARLLGAAVFAAHPASPRSDFDWTGWSLPGPWGLEVLNGDSQWREAGWGSLLRTAALYLLNPRYALLGSLRPPARTLARWDELLAQRDAPALVGADAHSRVPLGQRRSLRFPSYESIFALARCHVLLERPLSGDAPRDLAAIVLALRQGRSYVALDALAPADGFGFAAEAPGQSFSMGATVAPLPGLRLRAGGRLPLGALLGLIHDGRLVTEGTSIDVPVGAPGVYRVEAHLPGSDLPWVISNPIYVFDSQTAERRRAAAAWPPPPEAPPARRLLEDFEHGSTFAAERDVGSSLEEPVVAAGLGLTGAAGRLRFSLSRPDAGGPPHGWCALMDRRPRDFSGFLGVSLALKADGVYRLWLLVRDRNPRGSDEGSETWLYSLRTSVEWQRLGVPFARFRSLDPHSDGRLDLGQVTALGFVLDDLTVKPGTRGTVLLDDVGLY